MVSLRTNAPELAGEIAEEIRLFIDERRIEEAEEAQEGYFLTQTSEEKNGFYSKAVLFVDGEKVSEGSCSLELTAKNELEFKKYKKRAAKQSVYNCLRDHFRKEMPWGSLTGIRPTKLLRKLMAEHGEEDALRMLEEEFFVNEEKRALAKEICRVQHDIIHSADDRQVDIYIGIPFCTTRCAYCSFASGLTTKNGLAEQAYVDALLREIEASKPIFDDYAVRSVYIGGGTPSALRPDQLKRVLEAAGKLAEGTAEFTVEAGRPDTITREKLELIKAAGADRISVNAQTTHNDTLVRIGRQHTAEEFFDAYRLAREIGFDAINMDMIVGLPGEDLDIITKTTRELIDLDPENITIHTLAIKRASRFAAENAHAFATAEEAEEMLTVTRRMVMEAGYEPYYLYRQKYMAGNLENVGYAKPGKACIYNIDIMEETMSIVALGAGGISKRLFGEEDRIERAPNVKDIKHYVERTEEMAQRKLELFLR